MSRWREIPNTAGDEVLVYFKNFDWNQPRVIGFRRAPKKLSGRLGWTQIS